jgi:hypothetical protein
MSFCSLRELMQINRFAKVCSWGGAMHLKSLAVLNCSSFVNFPIKLPAPDSEYDRGLF